MAETYRHHVAEGISDWLRTTRHTMGLADYLLGIVRSFLALMLRTGAKH